MSGERFGQASQRVYPVHMRPYAASVMQSRLSIVLPTCNEVVREALLVCETNERRSTSPKSVSNLGQIRRMGGSVPRYKAPN